VKVKPVVPRVRAREDVDAAVDYYVGEAGADVALAFVDALEEAYGLIGRAGSAGSSRWSHDLNLPGLRTVRLKAFPWLVFYLERADHVDVWRVLHTRRDIPKWMSDAEESFHEKRDPGSRPG
jgi:toxin ParE1/3/4